MYEGVFSPIPDPDAYLARLGLNPEDYRKDLHPQLPDSPSAYSAPPQKGSTGRSGPCPFVQHPL